MVACRRNRGMDRIDHLRPSRSTAARVTALEGIWSAGTGWNQSVHHPIGNQICAPAVLVQVNTIGVLYRALARFHGQWIDCRRVMTGSAPASASKPLAKACKTRRRRPISTRPFTPGSNGRGERDGLRPTSSTSRPFAAQGPAGLRSRTPRNGTGGGPAAWRWIAAPGRTQPSTGAHLSSSPLIRC